LRDGEPQPLLQERGDLGRDVVVVGVDLHRSRLALHVHQADVAVGVGDDAGEVAVAAERGDVVDELGAERERAARDLGLRRVDRDRQLARDRLEDRDDASQLLVRGDALGPRPSRLAADVDDLRTFLEHPPGRGDRIVGSEVDAAVGEGVGRHVDDAHHRGSRETLFDRPPHRRESADA
jgi:hypothetical protein